MIPLLAPGATRHSSSNSKLRYFSLVTMSIWSDLSHLPTTFIAPCSTCQHFEGKLSRRNPRHSPVDLPSNKICHFGLPCETEVSANSKVTAMKTFTLTLKIIALFLRYRKSGYVFVSWNVC